jgi:hypothetical protein
MFSIIKSKARVFGDSINTLELIEALKSSLFKEKNAPVLIFTQHHSGFLKMIYECPHCNKLHFVCGEMDKSEHLDNLIVQKRIHADHYSDGMEAVTKEELIAVLEKLSEPKKIVLEHTQDPSAYYLTQVYKCSEDCPSVHLDSAYSKDSLQLN